jgi:hypothetical protein
MANKKRGVGDGGSGALMPRDIEDGVLSRREVPPAEFRQSFVAANGNLPPPTNQKGVIGAVRLLRDVPQEEQS